MKDYIGYCGWNCETCQARIATINDDDELRSKVAKQWSELYQCEITPDMINYTGCRLEGIKTSYCESMCQIRKCAMDKGYKTYGECSELDNCEKVAMVFSYNKEANANLLNG